MDRAAKHERLRLAKASLQVVVPAGEAEDDREWDGPGAKHERPRLAKTSLQVVILGLDPRIHGKATLRTMAGYVSIDLAVGELHEIPHLWGRSTAAAKRRLAGGGATPSVRRQNPSPLRGGTTQIERNEIEAGVGSSHMGATPIVALAASGEDPTRSSSFASALPSAPHVQRRLYVRIARRADISPLFLVANQCASTGGSLKSTCSIQTGGKCETHPVSSGRF